MTMQMKVQGNGKRIGNGNGTDMLISQLADSDGQELFHKDKGSLIYQLEAEDIADSGETAVVNKKLGGNA
jgi:hypothetical protein